jgi:DNA-binding NarL/FixJ family response regulator
MDVRIVLVDDHRILRDGLRMILQKVPGFAVVGEVGDGRSAMECVRQTAPDLVVMDLQLPDENGIACTQRILAERPGTKILVLSANPDLTRVQESLRAGASGYVLKDEAADELVRAVRTVMDGKVHLSPSAATALVEDLKAAPNNTVAPAAPKLSEREMAVLKLVVDGLRNKEIAEQLDVSTKSVETYRARVMSKLGCASTAELVRYALRAGIIAP